MTLLAKLPGKALKRFEMFPELNEMRREMDTLFERFERRFLPLAPMDTEVWMPSVDVFEKEGKIVVKAELPGLEQKDIKVYVTDHTLVIEGRRERDETIEKDDWFRRELSYGEFIRRIDLPPGVKPEEIHAEYRGGVLEVAIPKAEVEMPREIPIQVM